LTLRNKFLGREILATKGRSETREKGGRLEELAGEKGESPGGFTQGRDQTILLELINQERHMGGKKI